MNNMNNSTLRKIIMECVALAYTLDDSDGFDIVYSRAVVDGWSIVIRTEDSEKRANERYEEQRTALDRLTEDRIALTRALDMSDDQKASLMEVANKQIRLLEFIATLKSAVESDAKKFYGENEAALKLHMQEECGSGHCGYCSEAPNPYAETFKVLRSFNV